MSGKTPITLDQFQSALKGSKIKDSLGRLWEFKDDPQDLQDRDVWRMLECPGYDAELIQHCRSYPDGPHLIDEDHGILCELNHVSVCVVA